jgi:hypothetical protein
MVQIQFQLGRDELIEFLLRGYSVPDWARPLRIAGYSGVAAGVLLLVIGPGGSGSIAPILLIALGLFVLLFLVWRGHSDFEKALAAVQDDLQPHTIVINDDGLRWSVSHGFAEYRWEAFDHFLETPQLLVLYISSTNTGPIIPKRALPDAQELAALRKLLTEKITRPPPAFPVVMPARPAEPAAPQEARRSGGEP